MSELNIKKCANFIDNPGRIFIQKKLRTHNNPAEALATGVNPVDTYIRSGKYKNLPILPYIPGKDGAGIVHSIGMNVTSFNIGERVYFFGSITGSYAQYTICSITNVFSLPIDITFAQGACLGTPAFTAYRALFDKGKAKPGERIFIHGASGGVGLFTVEMAKSIGLEVIGTAGTSEGIEAVLNAGASEVFNHHDAHYIEDIQRKYPQGFDICIEMLASSNLNIDFSLMAMNGRIVIVGSRGSIEINPRDIMTKELEVYGVMLFNSSPHEIYRTASFIDALLKHHQLNPIISLTLPLNEAPTAHAEIIERNRFHVGNIVLIPPHDE